MNTSMCAVLALALSLSGAAMAQDPPTRGQTVDTLAPTYWHCIYESSLTGGVYEFVQRGPCRFVVDDPNLGMLTLIDAYRA